MSSASATYHGGAPLLSSMDAHTIENKFIVTFRPEVTEAEIKAHNNYVFTTLLDVTNASSTSIVTHYYDSHVLKGYAGRFEPHVLQTLRASPIIEFIEKDQMVHAYDVQENAPWGLARISQKSHLEGNEAHSYTYSPSAGEGVTVYVVDTGINIKHVDFEGRAEWGATIPDGDEDVDGNGHGTHCAGTIAGRTFGVAKKAKVVAVKVLRSNGSGSMSDVIKGIEYVALQHEKRVKEAETADTKRRVKSVANMSLGGGRSYALDRVVNAAVDSGVVFAVAAGNDGNNACYYSPAAAKKAITVGASTIHDTNAWFSNHGKCVDVFAPGLDITSTWIGSDSATNTISGTSMASPHVAGLSAVIMGEHEEVLSPQQVKDYVLQHATKNMLKFKGVSKRTPNKLIFHQPSSAETTGTPMSGMSEVVRLTWEHRRARLTSDTRHEHASAPSSKHQSQPKPLVRHNDLLVSVFHHPAKVHQEEQPVKPSRISQFLRIINERLSARRLRQLVLQM